MVKLLYIDLFCGAGGTSTGVDNAMYDGHKCARVIACVNHDPKAIASHLANHPETRHYTEDIRTLDLTDLSAHLAAERAANPGALVVLWASLECTNFSNAKGGLPRDPDSRTLADHLFRYVEQLRPDYIQIENVREFMSWGDLDENGHPVSKDRGRLYLRWVRSMCRRGYRFDHRILNAADYGAYTTRERFFGIFARPGLPIVFPEQTHCKDVGPATLFHDLKPWKPVRDVLDFQDQGESIFGRKTPLCEATLRRIYAGLIKFVAGGKTAFLIKWNSMNQAKHYVAPGIDEPCPTVTTQNRIGVASVSFLVKNFSGEPEYKVQGVDRPAGTITCRDHHSFITAAYSRGGVYGVDKPAPTVTTQDRLAFIDLQFGTGHPASIDRPANTLTANPKLNLVTVCPFLVNPQYKSAGGSVDDPCFTLIARMDKRPPSLVEAETGQFPPRVSKDEETPEMRKILEFCALYAIADIKMRMLRIRELKRIMGFPEDYALVGNQSEQKKFIGNAVEVNMAKALCSALYGAIARTG